MIRQLPKITLPSFMKNRGAEQAISDMASNMTEPEIKIYDLITASTVHNSEGNTMQLQLSQKDSEVNEGVRELHGRIVLNTENMPDKQRILFGFLISEDQASGKYDGLGVSVKLDAEEQAAPDFKHRDISTVSKPDIFSEEHGLKADDQNDWVIVQEDSYVRCEDVGRCELSVAFMRNFDTMDESNDVIFTEFEEQEYSLMGFYKANSIENNTMTHVGQSSDMYILMGAFDALTSSSLLMATAVMTLAAF